MLKKVVINIIWFLLCFLFNRSFSTIITKALQTDLKDAVCVSAQADPSTKLTRKGYLLTDLLDNPSTLNYKAFGISIWYKYSIYNNEWNSIFGLSENFSADTLQQSRTVLNYWNNPTDPRGLLFQSTTISAYSDKSISALAADFNAYMNIWRKAIILYQPNQKKAYLRVSDGVTTADFTMNLSSYKPYIIHYTDNTGATINDQIWLNIDHAQQQATHTNSCSKQKYVMFHYSNDDEFGIDKIQSLYFDYYKYQGYKPFYYFSFKRISDSQSQFTSVTQAPQKFKNMYQINWSEFINGSSSNIDANDISYKVFSDDDKVYAINMVPGTIVSLPLEGNVYQLLLSFVVKYDVITDALTLFSNGSSLVFIAKNISGQNKLQVVYNNEVQTDSWDFGATGSRHTLVIKIGSNLSQTKITYLVDSTAISTIQYSFKLTPFTQIQIGTSTAPTDPSLDNFQIKDFYIYPNADAKKGDDYPDETDFVKSNCDLYAQFNYNQAYCLVCPAGYFQDFLGDCQIEAQDKMIVIQDLFFGSKIISIVDSIADPRSQQLIYNYSRNDNNFDFLIIGYYKLEQWEAGSTKKVTLAYLNVDQGFQYYFLHLYLESETKVTLKMTLDVENLVCSTSVTYSQSLLNKWVFFGFGYQTLQAKAYFSYQDLLSNLINSYSELTCSAGKKVGTPTTSFNVCLGCYLPNPDVYNTFIGKIKNVKLIEGFNDYTNFRRYKHIDRDIMERSSSDINYQNINSLKEMFTLSLPGLAFQCLPGYLFFEGMCIDQNQCSNIVRVPSVMGNYNALYGDTTLGSCEICPQYCLSCNSNTECLSCRVGYILDSTSKCVPCPQNQYYQQVGTTQSCVTVCPQFTDFMNKICASQFDLLNHSSLPLLNVQYLTNSSGFQILDQQLIAQVDNFVKCSVDAPYISFSFYGGQQVTSTHSIKKSWVDLPNHYQKTVTFIIALYDSNSVNDISVTFNGQTITYKTFIIIKSDKNICMSSIKDQMQTVSQVEYEIIDNNKQLDLVIKFSKDGFAIRNVSLNLKKCHSSCLTCKDGPYPWNCDDCLSKNDLRVDTQCICQKDEYYKSEGCYSSPCYNCIKCSVANCLRCQDETGQCIQCQTGFNLLNGTCVSDCTTQINFIKHQSASICYLSKSLAFDHFQKNLIYSNLEFWKEQPDYVTTQGLLSCLNQKFLPNLGNEFMTLRITLQKFQSRYQGFYFDMEIIIVDSLDANQDFIIFALSNQQIAKATFPYDGSQPSTCGATNFGDRKQLYNISAFKNDGDINLKITGQFNEGKDNESFTMGNFKGYYIVNEPLCSKYTTTANFQSATCSECIINSKLNTSNSCVCNEGFYLFYDVNLLDGVCLQCNEACTVCTGPTVYDCSKCKEGYFNDGQKCRNDCNEGEYKNDKNQCVPCNDLCFGCTGPADNQCTSCKSGYFYYSSKCYQNCQDANPNTVPDQWSKVCETPRERQGVLLFSSQSFFTTEMIQQYKISSTYGTDNNNVYTCQLNNKQMLGVFPGDIKFEIANIMPHSVLKLDFLIFFRQACSGCQLKAIITDNLSFSTQDINISDNQGCSDDTIYPYSFIIKDLQADIKTYTFQIQIQNADFAISNIKLNTIVCHPSCLYCVGPDSNQCTDCFAGSSILNSQQIGECRCNEVQQGLGLTTIDCTNPFGCVSCKQCSQACTTCFKNDAQSCLTCPNGTALYISSCVDSCPSDITIPEIIDSVNVCSPCPHPCNTCTLSKQCTSCKDGYLFVPDQKQCVQNDCPVGYYLEPIQKLQCLKCDDLCKTCANSSSSCIDCSDGYFLVNDPVTGIKCLACDIRCQSCKGPTNKECIQCSDSIDIIEFKPNNTDIYCSVTCDEVLGYYQGYDANNIPKCIQCAPNCAGCSSQAADNCTSCMKGYTLQESSCSSCDASCSTCSGMTDQDCLSCKYPMTLSNGQCLSKCPSSFFIKTEVTSDSTLNTCQQCPQECTDCTSLDTCTLCQFGYYLSNGKCLICQNNCEICYGENGSECLKCAQGYFLQNKVCLTQCKTIEKIGYYGDAQSRSCKQCDQSCFECSNKYSYTCNSCYDGYYILQGTCYKCPIQSKTCEFNETNKTVDQLSCNVGYFYYNKQCVSSCPKGFYQDAQSQQCKICNSACKECLDSSSDQCSSCQDGYVLASLSSCQPCSNFLDSCEVCSSKTNCIKCPSNRILFEGKCITECDKERGLYTSNMECKPCVSPCIKCESQSVCIQCGNKFILNNAKTCDPCNIQCNTCDGLSFDNCLSCNTGFYLQESALDVTKKSCTLNCNQGYFADKSTLTCKKCDQSCLECVDSTKCSKCKSGYYQAIGSDLCTKCKDSCTECDAIDSCFQCQAGNYLNNKDCISSCPEGQIGNNGVCIPCDPNCKTCTIQANQCTSCFDGFYQSGTICTKCTQYCDQCTSATSCQKCSQGKYLEDEQCKDDCLKPGYFKDTTLYQCVKCDSSCQTCNGSSSRNCLTCNQGYYFSSLLAPSGTCVKCNENCTECFGPSSQDCTKCREGTQFVIPNTCVSCPTSQFFDGTNCVSCSNLCQTCFGASANNCLTCKDEYFINLNTNTCSKCPDTCITCIDNSFCTSCQKGKFLLNNSTCVDKCPDGLREENGICLCHITCNRCKYDEILKQTTCSRCINNNYLLNGQNAACIPQSECNNYKDIINGACVDSCPPQSKYIDIDNKTCSNNPCSASQYTQIQDNITYCRSSCSNGYYQSDQSKTCLQCDSKCQVCKGPQENQCQLCTNENYYHPEISTCSDSCLPGYVQLTSDQKVCTQCKTNCKFCISTLVLYEGSCIKECPVGYQQVGNTCTFIPDARVKISNVVNDQTISINSDFEIKSELFSASPAQYIVWEVLESLDKKFQSDFSEISSGSLMQVIPFILLSPSNSFIIKITITLMDGTVLSDKVRIKTPDVVHEGQFSVDLTSGESFKQVFVFQITDWSYTEQLYFDLNFYELQGVQQPDLSGSSSSSQSNFDFVKDKLFKLYEKMPLSSSKQIPYQFQAFDSDVNLICELKVFSLDNSAQSYKYLLIKLKKYSGQTNNIKLLQDQLSIIKSTVDQEKIGLLMFNYSFLLNYMIKRDSTKVDNFNSQVNLRQTAKLSGVTSSDLLSCENSIDCFAQGQCVNNALYKETCFCSEGFYGQNCEWNKDQNQIITDSFIAFNTILSQQSQISSIIQVQIIENLTYYFNNYYLKYETLAGLVNIYNNLLNSYLASSLGQVSGQILQRSLSLLISQLRLIKQDVSSLISSNHSLHNKISTNLNVGEKLISSSDSNDSMSYPFLLQQLSSSNASRLRSLRRLKKVRFLDKDSSKSVPVVFGELTVSFPPEVISVNKKQVIQASKWKKNPRDNPLAITQSISISMSSGGQENPVNNLSEPILLTIPKTIPSPVSANPEAISCTYYDEATNSFKSDGCTFVKETILNIICSCTHLTDFTAQMLPEQVKSTVKLSDITNSIKIGNSELQSRAGKKVVVNSLPPLKIGQRSVNLVNQLNILQSGSALNLVKKNTIILLENELYTEDISEFWDSDSVVVKVSETKEEQKVAESVFMNKIELLFYILIAIIVFFFLCMRARPKFKYIDLNNRLIKMFEANYFKYIEESLKPKLDSKGQRKQTVVQNNKKTDRQQIGLQKYQTTNNSENYSQSYNKKQQSLIEKQLQAEDNRQRNSSYISIISNDDDDDKFNSKSNLTQMTTNVSSKFGTTKKSSFSYSKLQSANLLEKTQQTSIISEEDCDNQSKSENFRGSVDCSSSILKKPEIFSRGQNKHISFKEQNNEKLNTIIDEEEETELNSENQQQVSINKKVQLKNTLSLKNIQMKRKEKQKELSFSSMEKQVPKNVDKDYENHIQDSKEKRINPRIQSLKNLQNVTKLLKKLKRNQELLNGIQYEKQKPTEILSMQNTLIQKKDQLQKSLSKYKKDEVHSLSYLKQQEQKLKLKSGFKFLMTIQKQEDACQQIKQLIEQRDILVEHMNESKIGDNNLYEIDSRGRVYFSEYQIQLTLQKQQIEQIKFLTYENQDKNGQDPKQRNAKLLKRDSKVLKGEMKEVLKRLNQEIDSKQRFILMMSNILNGYLQINSFNIFQLYSLVQYTERLFSNRFTKCMQVCCQLVLAIMTNLVFYSSLTQNIQVITMFGIIYLYLPRIIITTLISYAIPYFFFGCLTKIFATSSKSLQELDFVTINQIRKHFLISYIFIGVFQVCLCLGGIYYYSTDEMLQEILSFSYLIFEVIFSFILSGTIIDGIFFLIYTYYLSETEKLEDGTLNNFLACRGFYYYKGFDNINIYRQYYLAQLIEDD